MFIKFDKSNSSIKVTNIGGPLNHLENNWHFTEFEDGTKVESVENRMMVFNPCIKHRSTTTTNAMGRYNINFNYF